MEGPSCPAEVGTSPGPRTDHTPSSLQAVLQLTSLEGIKRFNKSGVQAPLERARQGIVQLGEQSARLSVDFQEAIQKWAAHEEGWEKDLIGSRASLARVSRQRDDLLLGEEQLRKEIEELRLRCATLRGEKETMMGEKDAQQRRADSLALELARCQACRQEEESSQAENKAAMSRLEEQVATLQQQCIQTAAERDMLSSQLAELRIRSEEQADKLASCHPQLEAVQAEVTRISQGLAYFPEAVQSSYRRCVQDVQKTHELLLKVARERDALREELNGQPGVMEERFRVREQELLKRLSEKLADVFQAGFEGSARILRERGYPPAGEDTSYLNYIEAMSRCPSGLFDL